MENFGKYLKQKRIFRGLSIRKLATLAGVSDSYLSQIENGKREAPSPGVLKKLASHLEVSYIEMMQKAKYLDNDVEIKKVNLKEFAKQNQEYVPPKVMRMLEDEKGPAYLEVIADLYEKGMSPEEIKQLFSTIEKVFINKDNVE